MSQHHHYTWPKLPDVRHRVACEYCDTLHEVDLIEEGKAAHCRECGAVLGASWRVHALPDSRLIISKSSTLREPILNDGYESLQPKVI